MITLDQQPERLSLSRQDLVFVASSTETGQTNFKYKVHVHIIFNFGSIAYDFFISPNASESCVVNVRDLVAPLSYYLYSGDVHALSDLFLFEDDASSAIIDEVVFSEWWDVDGVLTENAGSEVGISDIIIVRQGYFHPKYGYKPDPESSNTDISLVLNGNTKRALSDRKWNTHRWHMAESFGLSVGTTVCCIPCFEEDYGLLLYTGSATILPSSTVAKVKITLYDSSGTPHSLVEPAYGNTVDRCSCYPANLNANTTTVGLPQPADYPGWRFYTVQFLTSADAICGMTYVFYNAELYGQHDCKFDRVRLGWANSRGGWDYFNFIKKNEESFSMERKRFHQIRGNYHDAGLESLGGAFTYGGYDAGITERGSIIENYLSITSDWIQEGEFEFLQSLLFSNQVHWIQDDGSFIPVVIEANDYVSRRDRNGKQRNLDLKLRMANNIY